MGGFPNKGAISVVFLFCELGCGRLVFGVGASLIWYYLFEVAVRVWCRVAAGGEVVVEVFFEAGELGVGWLAAVLHLGFLCKYM